MKAITVIQPWATLLASGRKRIETRSWRTNYRGGGKSSSMQESQQKTFSARYMQMRKIIYFSAEQESEIIVTSMQCQGE